MQEGKAGRSAGMGRAAVPPALLSPRCPHVVPTLTHVSPCPQQSPPVTLVLGDESCWLSRLPLVPGEPDANAVIFRKGGYLPGGHSQGCCEERWCKMQCRQYW